MPTVDDYERSFLLGVLGASAVATDTIQDLRYKFYKGVSEGSIVLGGSSLSKSGAAGIAYIYPVANSWYGAKVPGTSETAGLNVGRAIGAVHMVPFSVRSACTLKNIAIGAHSNGDATLLCRIGLYEDDGTFWPGNRVVDYGTLVGSNLVPNASILAGTPLQKDKIYWAVMAFQGSVATYPNIKASGALLVTGQQAMGSPNVTSDQVLNAQDEWLYMPAGSITGAFPATFPSRATSQPISQAPNFALQIQ